MTTDFVVRQEPDAIARRKLLAIAAGGLVLFAVSLVSSWWLLVEARSGRDTGPARAAGVAGAPSTIGTLEQRLVLASPRGLELRQRDRASLDEWGWVDRDAGVARIPIERAMDLVAADAGAHR